MRQILVISFGVLIAVSVMSCNKDKTKPVAKLPDYCKDSLSFTTDVKPIFDVNCSTSGCHGGSSAQGGYALNNYLEISASAEDCLKAMSHDATFTNMPIGGTKLADSIIQKLECWILQGKLNN